MSAVLVVLAVVVLVGALAAPAHAVEAAQPVQGGVITRRGPFVPVSTRFLTERARPASTLVPSVRRARPEDLYLLDGESEAFQLVFLPDTSGRVEIRLSPDTDPWLTHRVRFYRVENVAVRTPSSGQGTAPGLYPDPIPPQVGALGTFNVGDKHVDAGTTSAFLIVVEDTVGDNGGTRFEGDVDLVTDTGRQIARQHFTATVGNARALQPGDARGFKVGAGFKPKWYKRGMPATSSPEEDREQSNALLAYLAKRGVSVNNWPEDSPERDGRYAESQMGALDTWTGMPWDVQFLQSFVGSLSIEQNASTDYAQLVTALRTMGREWIDHGFVARNPTWMYLFDEPDVTEQHATVGPISTMVHRDLPGVHTFITGTPRRSVPARTRCIIQRPGARRTCLTLPATNNGNEFLWDGSGTDDLDAWAPLIYRQYGRATPLRERLFGFSRTSEYLEPIRAARSSGAETWTYSFYAASRRVPTLAIDSAGVDPTVLTWQHAMAGHRGWYIWQFARWSMPVVGDDRPRDPWRTPLSIITRHQGWYGNGVASFIYPANRPDLGISGATLPPVGSLRLEGLRAGIEDYGLLMKYRSRFGEAAMQGQVRPLFGPLRATGLSTGEVWPAWSEQGMAERMELRRRAMIAALSSNI